MRFRVAPPHRSSYRSPKKMTRSEMASFIRKIAADDFDQTEWNSVMVNHYEDIPTEDARARAVEVYHGHSEVPEEHKTECLTRLADALELPINERDFYLQGGAVGILREFPSSDGEIGYEPYRGGSHYAMQNALKEGKQPICEFMRDGRRCSFTVFGCPSYGHLTIKMNR